MEKRIIPTCIANNLLNSLIREIEENNFNNNFKIKCMNRDDFLKNKLTFVMLDEAAFSEILKKEIVFKQVILIRTSSHKLENLPGDVEIISIDVPFKFSDLYQIISNRFDLITSQTERVIHFNFFSYDPRIQSLFNKNFSMRFTEKESDIFEYLLENSNKYVQKKVLLKEIWSYSEDIDTHTLETHIYSLRKKISENFTLKELINFEEKKGYYLNKNIL